MAFTTVGFDGTVTEAQWSNIMVALGAGLAPTVVTTGFDGAPGVGTRSVTISPGTALVAGVLVNSSAIETVTVSPNAGSVNRLDLVVLRVNWATNTAAIAVLTGGTVLPAPTQTPGVLWEVPLAAIQVNPSQGVLASNQVAICKPVPRIPRITVVDLGEHVAAPAFNLTVLDLTDPGWPYRIDISAAVRAVPSGSFVGSPQLSARVNGTDFGLVVGTNFNNNSGRTVLVNINACSGVITGPSTFSLFHTPLLPGGGSYDLIGATNKAIIRQIPA